MKTLTYGNAHICFATAMLVSMMAPQIALSQSSDTITVTDDAHRITADIVSESGDIGSVVRDAVTKNPRIMTANTLVCQARYALDLAKASNSMVITGSLEGNSKLIGNVPKTGGSEVRGRSFNSDYNNAVDLKLRLGKTLWDADRTRYNIGSSNYRYQAEQMRSINQTSELLLSLLTMLAEIVPAQSDMLVRAKLLPQDIADVSVGQDSKGKPVCL
jgi:hypothetical protein